NKAQYAFMPFCHTTEAEGYGAKITLTDGNGARASELILKSIDELSGLKDWDLNSGRFASSLEACRLLKKDGHYVVFTITGPLGILNCLLDASQVFKLLRKKGPALEAFYAATERNLLAWADAAVEAGADCIAYADPMAGADIAGPKYAEQLTRDFVAPLIVKMRKRIGDRAALSVCPKVWLTMSELGIAKDYPEYSLPEDPEFGFCKKASDGIYGRYCTKSATPKSRGILFEIDLDGKPPAEEIA
ncbi:MAG: hypothetical protein IJG63_01935, partial [Oscillospiraceae bacterium]|nr:hypothetical protein [Oscillospiraceae bacterium]